MIVRYTYDAFGRLVKREGTSVFAGPRLVFWNQSGRVLEGIVDQTEGEMTITGRREPYLR